LTVLAIARLRGISRQAVHRTVSGLIEPGYLELKLAEGSQRDKVVIITPSGQNLRKDVGEQLETIKKDRAGYWRRASRNISGNLGAGLAFGFVRELIKHESQH
tara:strand:+ start:402 stop:710 length:309 start_codon:yes stop_codon:yes gene_type:complete